MTARSTHRRVGLPQAHNSLGLCSDCMFIGGDVYLGRAVDFVLCQRNIWFWEGSPAFDGERREWCIEHVPPDPGTVLFLGWLLWLKWKEANGSA
jgi:hypothetical protein